MKILFVIFFAVFILVGCQQDPSQSNSLKNSNSLIVSNDSNASNKSNIFKPKADLNTPKEAIETFLKSKYNGWKLVGDTLDNSMSLYNGSAFDVHLHKNNDDKVISLILKMFQDLEGNSYWLAYEPTKLEIAQLKLSELKNNIKDESYTEGYEKGKEDTEAEGFEPFPRESYPDDKNN